MLQWWWDTKPKSYRTVCYKWYSCQDWRYNRWVLIIQALWQQASRSLSLSGGRKTSSRKFPRYAPDQYYYASYLLTESLIFCYIGILSQFNVLGTNGSNHYLINRLLTLPHPCPAKGSRKKCIKGTNKTNVRGQG